MATFNPGKMDRTYCLSKASADGVAGISQWFYKKSREGKAESITLKKPADSIKQTTNYAA